MLPKFRNYGNYSSNNYGVNSICFDLGNLEVYFSYETPVAFCHPSTGLIIRQNAWGPTTGKHLNWIDSDKSKRISGKEFKQKLNKILEEI